MTTVKELRRDINEIKTNCYGAINTEEQNHISSLNKALIEYARVCDLTSEEDKREAIKEIIQEYGNRTGRWNDLSIKE